MELLEYLARVTGCQYLSDLPYAGITAAQADELRGLGGFSPQEYCRAAEYLSRGSAPFTDPQAAREAVIAHLLKNGKA